MTKVFLKGFVILRYFPGKWRNLNRTVEIPLADWLSPWRWRNIQGWIMGSFVWRDSSILLCVAKYISRFWWPKSASVHADFPPMDSKQTVVCCYRRRSLQWRKEACPMGIVREYTERRITWDTTTIALQESFPMEGANYRITLRKFPVSQFAIICCIPLQFPFNIRFALCSRADNYLNELFLNAAKVLVNICRMLQ